MNTPDREFDGEHEQLKMHRGAEFGLSGETYRNIASACMAAKRYAGIEPCSIEHLDGRPGAIVTLYGGHLCFFLTVEAGWVPNRVTLSSVRLDCVEEPVELLAGSDESETWRRAIDAMLRLEGLTPEWRAMSYEEASEYLRRQGLI